MNTELGQFGMEAPLPPSPRGTGCTAGTPKPEIFEKFLKLLDKAERLWYNIDKSGVLFPY